MSSRGTTNVLTRATAILAALFFATSLLLSILAGIDRKPRSILQRRHAQRSRRTVGARRAARRSGGGVLDQLRGAPQAPPAPQRLRLRRYRRPAGAALAIDHHGRGRETGPSLLASEL